MKGRPRLSRFIGLALLAHAALAVCLGRTALSARVVPQGAEAELRVDIEPAETAAPETTPPVNEQPTASNAAGEPHVAASLRPATLANPAPAPQGEPSTEGAPAPADSAAGGWTLSPFASQGTARSGGAAPTGSAFDEAVRAGVRATVAEAAKRRDPLKHLLGGYSARDIELGLIPGGEYVALTRDGVRSSRAPNVGHATFEITVDGGGNLTAVRILDASSNRFEWDEAAQEIMKAAHGQRTRVPTGSQGLVLTLEVTSDIRTLSGLPPATTALGRLTRAIGDPLDAVVDGTVPLQRVIAARVLDVTVL